MSATAESMEVGERVGHLPFQAAKWWGTPQMQTQKNWATRQSLTVFLHNNARGSSG